jgi:hypothetical protein
VNVPVDRVTLTPGLPREGTQVGQNEVRDSQVGFVAFKPPNGIDADAEVSQLHVQNGSNVSGDKVIMGLLSAAHPSVPFLSLLKKTVEERKMDRIYVSLIGLQVIAVMKDLPDVEMVRGCFKKGIIGKQGRLPRSHVAKNHSPCFLARIGEMANIVPMLAAAGLSRLLQAATANVIEPTVIKTPQSAILDSAVAEVRSSVGAMNPQKPRAPLIVAEQNQIFVQNLHAHRRAARRQLF